MNLLPLETPLAGIRGLAPAFLKRLENLGVKTVRDLLWHFPSRYEDFSQIYKIAELEPGQQATVQGTIENIKTRHTWRRHLTIVEAEVADESGAIRAVWFNQPYLASALRPGRAVNLSGKVAVSDEGELYLSHPAYELLKAQTYADSTQTHAERDANLQRQSATMHTGRLVPIYPETRGLTSRGLRYLIKPILKNIERLPEWIPEEILIENDLPEINRALHSIHFPEEILEATAAKKRFAFEDLFLLQLYNLEQKLKLAEEKAPSIKTDLERLKFLIAELPFLLTPSQKKSLWEIIQDIEKPRPMNRLLQGDVGSGKTVVAAIAAIIAAENGLQTAFMAPTEVLAWQHFETLKKLFLKITKDNQPTLGLITSSGAKILYANDLEANATKPSALKKLADGEIRVVIGTHAIIQKSVAFKNLGFVVIDEQHRFGVRQRAALAGRRQAQTETQTDAENGLLYQEITFSIRQCLFEVRKKLGLGHKESVYQRALEEEFKNSKLNIEKEKSVPVLYDGKKVGVYRPDFIINKKVILELKALPHIGTIEQKQLWNYLGGSDYKLAILANFGPEKLAVERVIYDTARSGQQLSASSQQLSALVPHFLSMSATPIPRTLMLTIFGDLDISLITELPAGRKNIVTKIIPPAERITAYGLIREEISRGRQAFVICPRIDKPQTDAEQTLTNAETFPRKSASSQRSSALLWQTNAEGPRLSASSPRLSALGEAKAVKEEYEKLSQKVFPDLKVAMLHGQMKPKEKEKIMQGFRDGKTDVLVSTSVIEVGVDIPNATIMMIEGADRFGLAQLYQFRGRVGRGEHQSYCFLFTDSDSESTAARLKAIIEAKNGFELAERDLKIRGPGEFLGESQSGLPDFAMSALGDAGLVKSSREAAVTMLRLDPALKSHALLKLRLKEFEKNIHPE